MSNFVSVQSLHNPLNNRHTQFQFLTKVQLPENFLSQLLNGLVWLFSELKSSILLREQLYLIVNHEIKYHNNAIPYRSFKQFSKSNIIMNKQALTEMISQVIRLKSVVAMV